MRSVKSALKKVIGRCALNYDELLTVLTEIEGVINSRPITYVYDDEESVSYAVTPSQLIYGRRLCSYPNSQHYEIFSTNMNLTRRASYHRQTLRQFTSRWRKEYLLNLRESSQVNSKRQKTEELSVGDIVIIKNDKTNRSFWRLGRIERLITGGDGLNRAAIVKVSNEDGRTGTLRRSIEHLVPLEVNANVSAITRDEDGNSSLAREPDETSNRPRRAAAIASEDLRREL